jgi:rhodanese-related sulfurtransferase
MIKQVNLSEFLGLVKVSKNLKIVDVSTSKQYDKEHIKGAISLPLDKIETEAENNLKERSPIVVYSHDFKCNASSQAAEKLYSLGYSFIFVFKGGLKEYEKARLPVESILRD